MTGRYRSHGARALVAAGLTEFRDHSPTRFSHNLPKEEEKPVPCDTCAEVSLCRTRNLKVYLKAKKTKECTY